MKKLIQFILYSIIFYVLILVLWTNYMPYNFLKKNAPYPIGAKGFTFSRMKDVDSIRNVDILFLGSSHANRGFDTRIFSNKNIKSFNLGSPSQSPIQTKLLVENYIDQLNPKLVIYEVYPATFQNDGVESALDIIANSAELSSTFKMALEVNHLKVYNTLVVDSFRELLDLNQGYHEEARKNYDCYIKGGFIETSLKHNLNPINVRTKEKWGSKKWKTKHNQWLAFKETLMTFSQKNITVWLVQTPVTSEAYNLYTNNEYMDSIFSSTATYFNFNNIIKLNNHLDFIDYHHLTQRGVNKINTELINLIIQKNEYFRDLAADNE